MNSEDYLTKPFEGFRLSPQQRRLWQEHGGFPRPLGHMALTIDGDVESLLLERAIEKVVATHEILRTDFKTVRSVKFPCQVVESRIRTRCLARIASDGESEYKRALKIFATHDEEYLLNPIPKLLWSVCSSSTRSLLCLSVSQLLVDQRSFHAIFQQLATFYASNSCDGPLDIVQYVDYSEWRNDSAEEAHPRPSDSFLRAHVGRCPEPPQFSFERTQRDTAGRLWSRCRVPEHLQRDIDAAATESGVNVPDLLAGAWALLLMRMSASPEVTLLSCFEGRTHQELMSAVGPFETWMPVAAAAKRNTSFSELAKQLGRQKAELRDYQDHFCLDANYASPYANHRSFTGFDYVERPIQLMVGSRVWSILDVECHSEQMKLVLHATRNGSALDLKVGFDASTINIDAAESILPRMLETLRGISSCPDIPIAAVNVVPTQEFNFMVGEVGKMPRPNQLVTRLFDAQADRNPSGTALVCGDQRLTYRTLQDTANRAAVVMAQLDIGPESLIALLLPRSAEVIVGMLAALKAGACYVVIDPTAPRARIESELMFLRPSYVITRREYFPLLQAAGYDDNGVKSWIVDEELPKIYGNPPCPPDPLNLAYVVLTSGSTKTPKSVAVTYGALSSYVLSICERLGLDLTRGNALNFATASALNADLAYTCVYPALVSGSCLHILAGTVCLDPVLFAAYLNNKEIDILKIVPSHLQTLLLTEIPKLPRRAIILGGETFHSSLARRLAQSGSDCEIINHYGPAEAAVGCIAYSLTKETGKTWARTVPIGRPLAGGNAYVLTNSFLPVPLGTIGELYISSDRVARGYLNAANLTAEKFLPCPFGLAGARMYKTGDLVLQLPDGVFEFIGRVDDQVKIRGYRVEPGETEAVLAGMPGVSQAAVIANRREPYGVRLVAYYVTEPGAEVLPRDATDYLKERLPNYLVPAIIVPLSMLPVTPNGKIDRAALPDPELTREPEAECHQPKTRLEREVARIWREVLRIEHLNMDDRFFDIGGHSLLATQIVARARSVFKVEISLTEFFDNPTVSGMVESISQLWGGRDAVEEFTSTNAVLERVPFRESSPAVDQSSPK